MGSLKCLDFYITFQISTPDQKETHLQKYQPTPEFQNITLPTGNSHSIGPRAHVETPPAYLSTKRSGNHFEMAKVVFKTTRAHFDGMGRWGLFPIGWAFLSQRALFFSRAEAIWLGRVHMRKGQHSLICLWSWEPCRFC